MEKPITRAMAIRFLRVALAGSGDGTSFLNLLNRSLLEMAKAGELDPSIAKMSPGNECMYRDATHAQPGRADEAVRMLTAAFFECVTLGYILPSPRGDVIGAGGIFFGTLFVTPWGKEWVKDSDPIPEDSSGYLMTFDALVPKAHPVIRQYVAEALVVYERRAFFAAAVMLGAASEATVYHLADAVAAAFTNATERKNLRRAIDGNAIAEILRRVPSTIERVKKRPADPMPHSVSEGADAHLLSLQESIRVQRNKAGHPAAGKVEPVAVRLALSAFPAACRKAHDLAEWFRANKV